VIGTTSYAVVDEFWAVAKSGSAANASVNEERMMWNGKSSDWMNE
jgi:hypothetical protein